MKYDFDAPVDRRNTYSLKWDVAENELPMWVADMDFRTAPEITQALIRRAGHGVFGYTEIPDEWYSAYTNWWSSRHGVRDKARVADILHRRGSGDLKHGTQINDRGREYSCYDPGVQYLLQLDTQQRQEHR